MAILKGYKLLKPYANYKVGKLYDTYGGLVSGLYMSGLPKIHFSDATWFKPVYSRTKKTTVLFYTHEEVSNILEHVSEGFLMKGWSQYDMRKWFNKYKKSCTN